MGDLPTANPSDEVIWDSKVRPGCKVCAKNLRLLAAVHHVYAFLDQDYTELALVLQDWAETVPPAQPQFYVDLEL